MNLLPQKINENLFTKILNKIKLRIKLFNRTYEEPIQSNDDSDIHETDNTEFKNALKVDEFEEYSVYKAKSEKIHEIVKNQNLYNQCTYEQQRKIFNFVLGEYVKVNKNM